MSWHGHISIPAVALLFLTANEAALPETLSRSGAAQADIDRLIHALVNIDLKEEIARFAGAGDSGHQLDTFEAEVSIADGVEQYSGVRGHNRTYRHINDIGGLWSRGEIVTMLESTRGIIGGATRPEAIAWQVTPDRTIIRFRSASDGHLWFIAAAGKVFWLDFEGSIRISEQTGEVESLTWSTDAGPPGSGVASILWEVNFHAATVAGNRQTMPSDSVYRVVRSGRGRRAEWNRTRYTALGRYGATSTVSFRE